MRALLVALAFTPAWSYLPAPLRAHLAQQQGGTLYLPARTPAFYRYRSGAAVRDGVLTVTFTDRVRIRQGVWRWTKKTLVWQVSTRSRCPSGATKTLQMSGNRVYASGDRAWRCIGSHVLVATDPSGRLPDTALGEVAASGLNVAGR